MARPGPAAATDGAAALGAPDRTARSLISTRIPTLLQDVRQSHVRDFYGLDVNPKPLDFRLKDGEHVFRELAAHVIHPIMCDIINQTSDRLLDLKLQAVDDATRRAPQFRGSTCTVSRRVSLRG